MMKRGLLILIVSILVGCQTATETPVMVMPTAASLDDMSTERAATQFSVATPTRRPLPPTFTPSATFTLTPTDPASLPSPTPEGFRAEGTLYYIFNGDAIVELAADGSFEDLLPIPHIGQDISGLSRSPDDNLLAYVAPGAGSGREIYVTNRSGTDTRQVTHLGFAEVERPAWSPDGSALAFIAAQAPGAPKGIYMVFVDGTGQRAMLELPSTELRDLTWNHDGSRLFFSDTTIYSLDVATQALSTTLSAFSGFGPDFALAHSPTEPVLYYLKPRTNLDTGQKGGVLWFIDTLTLNAPVERPAAELYVDFLAYDRSGEYLLISDETGIWVQVQALQTASKILQDSPVVRQPVFSPDAAQVAYVGLDELGAEQIFKMNQRGEDLSPLTFHQDGTISDIVWTRG